MQCPCDEKRLPCQDDESVETMWAAQTKRKVQGTTCRILSTFDSYSSWGCLLFTLSSLIATSSLVEILMPGRKRTITFSNLHGRPKKRNPAAPPHNRRKGSWHKNILHLASERVHWNGDLSRIEFGSQPHVVATQSYAKRVGAAKLEPGRSVHSHFQQRGPDPGKNNARACSINPRSRMRRTRRQEAQVRTRHNSRRDRCCWEGLRACPTPQQNSAQPYGPRLLFSPI